MDGHATAFALDRVVVADPAGFRGLEAVEGLGVTVRAVAVWVEAEL
jgi:hypothetical protein